MSRTVEDTVNLVKGEAPKGNSMNTIQSQLSSRAIDLPKEEIERFPQEQKSCSIRVKKVLLGEKQSWPGSSHKVTNRVHFNCQILYIPFTSNHALIGCTELSL